MVYPMLQARVPSDDIGAVEENKRFCERAFQAFQKQAVTLGYKLALA
jgi:hypothetical protein